MGFGRLSLYTGTIVAGVFLPVRSAVIDRIGGGYYDVGLDTHSGLIRL